MKLTMRTGDLAKELAIATRIVARKETIPELQYALLEPNGDGLRVSSTDLDVALVSDVDAKITDPTPMLVHVQRLYDVVKFIPEDETIELSKKGATVEVKAGKYVGNFKTMNHETYPKIADAPASVGVVSTGLKIADLIKRVEASMAPPTESKYFMSGALMKFDGERIIFVTTDGHRLTFGESENKSPVAETILPMRTVRELKAFAADADQIDVTIGENHIFFVSGKRRLVSKMIDGKFPAYERVIPQTHDIEVEIDRDVLALAIRRVSQMSDSEAKGMKFSLSKDLLEVRGRGEVAGEAVEQIVVDYAGPEIAVGFNWQYVIDVLDVVPPGKVRLETINNPDMSRGSAGVFKSTTDGHVRSLSVIMSMSV